jgi:probable HAF family extracellular repeat protein
MRRFQDMLALLLFVLAPCGAATAQEVPQSGIADGKHGSRPTTYRVINLAPGYLATIPKINAAGQVSFSVNTGLGTKGYFYDGTSLQDIGSLGGGGVLAEDLNASGQITGRSGTASGGEHAMLWSASGGMVDILGTNSGYSVASAINKFGVVIGVFQPNGINAFRWSASTGVENLGAFTPGLSGASFANALNDAGLIAGMSNVASGKRHAFAWTRTGGLVDIDTLDSEDALPVAVGALGEVAGNRLPTLSNDALYTGFLWTRAKGMVELGKDCGTAMLVLAMTPNLRIAGFIRVANDGQIAVTWTPATGTRRLGTLGGASSRGYGVNAAGQVVGFADNKAGQSRAFLWASNTGMRDLNKYLHHAPPGLVLDDALAINDSGAIVATSNAGLVLLVPHHGHPGHHGGHVLGPVAAPALIQPGVQLQAAVAYVDEDRIGTRSVTWDWGDGSALQSGTVRRSDDAGNAIASASHSFAVPGIHEVTATVVDRNGRASRVGHTVVVTGPGGDTLAGTGTLMSQPGAFARAPAQAGPATFRLIAPASASLAARAGAVPARLAFDLPGFVFRSQDVRLVERQGALQVFEGSGTVGSKDGYRFRLGVSATGSGSESGRFALKIWHVDPATQKELVDYDNATAASGTASGRVRAGSIVQN